MGVANALYIGDERIIENMQAVQRRHNLPQTAELQGRQFSVEMETGTGKTYVYTKTKYSLQGTTQSRYLTGGVPPVRFSM